MYKTYPAEDRDNLFPHFGIPGLGEFSIEIGPQFTWLN